MQREYPHRLVPVLFVGRRDPDSVERLLGHGVGVITAAGVDRALRLLKSFSVAAVICYADALDRIPELTATGTSVIVLAAGDAARARVGVITLRRTATVAAIAAAVHQCVAERAARVSGEALSSAAAASWLAANENGARVQELEAVPHDVRL